MIAERISKPKLRPIFLADWRESLFIHFRVKPENLQPLIPLKLDLFDGHAYISLVAFTQHRLRPTIGGGPAEFLSRPLAHHEFFNLRTYVVHNDEPGIYFLSEWIPNRLAVFLGPRLYGLPYKLAQLHYQTADGYAMRQVIANEQFASQATWNPREPLAPCIPGSESEFLLERYTAFTFRNDILRRFRIAHDPWPQIGADITIARRDLLGSIPIGEPCGGHYSSGVQNVQISLPRIVAK